MSRLFLSVRLWCMGRLLLRPGRRRRRRTPWIVLSGPCFFLEFRGISVLFPASFVAPITPGRLIHSALSGLTPVTFRGLLFRWCWRSSSIIPSSAAVSPSVIMLRLLVLLVLVMLLMVLMLVLLLVLVLLFLRLGVATVLLGWLWWHLCMERSARLPLLITGPVSVTILRIVGRPRVQILWGIAGLMHLLPRVLIQVSGIHTTESAKIILLFLDRLYRHYPGRRQCEWRGRWWGSRRRCSRCSRSLLLLALLVILGHLTPHELCRL